MITPQQEVPVNVQSDDQHLGKLCETANGPLAEMSD